MARYIISWHNMARYIISWHNMVRLVLGKHQWPLVFCCSACFQYSPCKYCVCVRVSIATTCPSASPSSCTERARCAPASTSDSTPRYAHSTPAICWWHRRPATQVYKVSSPSCHADAYRSWRIARCSHGPTLTIFSTSPNTENARMILVYTTIITYLTTPNPPFTSTGL